MSLKTIKAIIEVLLLCLVCVHCKNIINNEETINGNETELTETCDEGRPCLNGGECKKVADAKKNGNKYCECKSGTSGDFCETVKDCDTMDCGSGTDVECAYDGISGGYCKCRYSGDAFDHDRKECRLACNEVEWYYKCLNGGKCKLIEAEKNQKGFCECKTGTSGIFCGTVKGCDTLDCGEMYDKSCSYDGISGGYCRCLKVDHVFDPSTKTCISPCSPNPCKNGGKCLVDGTVFMCACKEQFSGATCENDPCTKNYCLNDGHCSVVNGTVKCACRFPYSGDFCETNPCTKNPCLNGGHCSVENGTVKCACRFPYSGDFCETNPCSGNPCRNGGTCFMEGNVFKCVCQERFSGETCENGEDFKIESRWKLSAVLAVVILLTLILIFGACIGFMNNRSLRSIARNIRDTKT